MFAISILSASPHIEIWNEEGTTIIGTLYPPTYKLPEFPNPNLSQSFYPTQIEFSSDSQWLAASDPFVIFLFNLKTGVKRGPFNKGKFIDDFMVFSPDSSILAVTNTDMAGIDAGIYNKCVALIDSSNGQL